MKVFYFAVALTSYQLVTAATVNELNLETWSAQFGIIGHDDKVKSLAQTWFKNVTYQTELQVQGKTQPDITPLFVITLPVDSTAHVTPQRVLEPKENVIVVFRRNPLQKNGKQEYFFVTMTNWTVTRPSASPELGWQLTLFSQYGTIAHTQARIRSYCNSKHYNNLECPWNWVNSPQPLITPRSCMFNVEGNSITYTIRRHLNEFHLWGTLSHQTKPLKSFNEADLDDLIRQDVQKRVELTQLAPLNSPFDEIFSKKLSDCLLTKVFAWKLPNYYFLHYESSSRLILQGVIIREVFGKRALLTAWSGDINVENMSDEDKNAEVNKQQAECLNGKNPFLQEPTSNEYKQLLKRGSSLWAMVDEEDNIQVLSVFPMLMENPVFLKKPIVLICVIFDLDKNVLGYRYAVGDLRQEVGAFYCEYTSEDTFRSKEEVWKQITIYWNFITVPRWHLLENIFKDWQTKLLTTQSQTDSAAVVDSEFDTPTAATEEMIRTFELVQIRETGSDDWLVAGIYKCCENFHWVVLEVLELTEDFKQLGVSQDGLKDQTEALASLDKFLISLTLFNTNPPPQTVTMNGYGEHDPIVKKVQGQITSLINFRPNSSITDVSTVVKLTFYKPFFGKMIRCDCTYGDTNLVALVHPPVENRSMDLLYLSECLPKQKFHEKLLDLHKSESQVLLPFVEDWVWFDVTPRFNPVLDLFCEELQSQFETFLRKLFSLDPISETKTERQSFPSMIRNRMNSQKTTTLPAVAESKSIKFEFSACADKIQDTLKGLGLEYEKSSIKLMCCRSLSPGGNWKQVVLIAFGSYIGIGLRLNQSVLFGWTAVDCCCGGKNDIMKTMNDVRFNPNFLDTQEIRSSPGGFDKTIKNLLKWKFEDGAATHFESARTNLGNGRVYGTYLTEIGGNARYSGVLAAREKDKWSLIYSVTQKRKEDNVLVMLLKYESQQGFRTGVEDWFQPVNTQDKLQKILDDPAIKKEILAKLRNNSGLDKELDDESLTLELKLVQRQTADGNKFYFLCELRQNGTGRGRLGKFVVAFTCSTPKSISSKSERYEIQFVSRRRMDLEKTKKWGKCGLVRD